MAVGLTDGGTVAEEEVVETDDESDMGTRWNARPSSLSKMGQASVAVALDNGGGQLGTNPARGGRNMAS